MDRFGEKLRILRKRRGLTMKALATALGLLSHGTIGDLEYGRTQPSAQLVETIARYFEVSTDSLMFDELEV